MKNNTKKMHEIALEIEVWRSSLTGLQHRVFDTEERQFALKKLNQLLEEYHTLKNQ